MTNSDRDVCNRLPLERNDSHDPVLTAVLLSAPRNGL